MLWGIAVYFIGCNIPALVQQRDAILNLVSVIQPVLIFAMLFITFCKVNLQELKWRRWHGYLLLIQVSTFAALALWLRLHPGLPGNVIIEGAMLCLICPTATAATVVTAKLGGDAAGLTTYTILINLAVALVVPATVPWTHPHPGLSFSTSFLLVMGKVFPMLICPLFAAVIVRRVFPQLHHIMLSCKDLAFYIWAISLSIAIAVTARSIMHSDIAMTYQLGIAAVSFVCCIAQFAIGRLLGRHYGCPISAGQALGQKNTVFAIWMGYTFLTPVSAIAGGFYSIWHNVINSRQLYRKRQLDARRALNSQ